MKPLEDCYRDLFVGSDAERVLKDLRNRSYYDRPLTVTGQNVNGMLLAEGGRQMYMYIINQIDEGKDE